MKKAYAGVSQRNQLVRMEVFKLFAESLKDMDVKFAVLRDEPQSLEVVI